MPDAHRPEPSRGTPRSSRGYWICQIGGWGSFAVYVLTSYLWAVGPARRFTDVASILFFNLVVCPLVTHNVRRGMYARGWIDHPLRRLVPRLILVVPALAGFLTVLVDGVAFVLNRYRGLSTASLAGIFFGFCWAFAGWFLIYFIVHARRHQDALRLELAVTSRDAQLQSLRAQLNPHFLFNCLNSLRSLIVEDPARAASMVTGLAEILRVLSGIGP